jgi:hypothetical protein
MLFVCLVEGKRGGACVVDPIYKASIRSDDQIILAPFLHFDSQRVYLLRFCAAELFVPLTQWCIQYEYLAKAILGLAWAVAVVIG